MTVHDFLVEKDCTALLKHPDVLLATTAITDRYKNTVQTGTQKNRQIQTDRQKTRHTERQVHRKTLKRTSMFSSNIKPLNLKIVLKKMVEIRLPYILHR